MCTVSVKGRNVLVDGTSFGSTYSSHEIAIHQGKKVHEKHYPQAKFEIIPEPESVIEVKNPRNPKKPNKPLKKA